MMAPLGEGREARPRVVVSRCLGFDSCRYNGDTVNNAFIEGLAGHVDLVTVCPEVEGGLGVPRDPIRIVLDGGAPSLYQPATGRDVTGAIAAMADSFLGGMTDVDGFILKSKSPSCGIGDVKIYPNRDAQAPSGRGTGLFATDVLRRFPGVLVEDEDRLRNPRVREHFLTFAFTLARFRAVESSAKMSALVAFHAEHKMLLMAYGQEATRSLGRLVSNRDRLPIGRVLAEYRAGLSRALARGARYTSNVNVLQHAFGYVSDGLSEGEKALFLRDLELYRDERVPLRTCLDLVRSWAVRFDVEYLLGQRFFMPFPDELMELSECSSRRDMW